VPRLVCRRSSAVSFRAAGLVALAAVAVGCEPATTIRSGDIRTYTVPKDAEPEAIASPSSASGPAVAPSLPGPTSAGPASAPLRYEVPEGWSDAGGSGMRLATLLIGAAADKHEVTIIPASGSLAGNVERWQGQLDAAADAADLKARAAAAIAAAESVDVAGTPATLVMLRDAEARADPARGQAILGAMIPLGGERALFVKFKGDSAVADRERERFARFVSSIRWQE
jgi:hypothetical protein